MKINMRSIIVMLTTRNNNETPDIPYLMLTHSAGVCCVKLLDQCDLTIVERTID